MADTIDQLSQLSFEDTLALLEETVATLEAGSLPLDDALSLYEQGQALALRCSKLLDAAELRVEQLTGDGEIIDVSSAV